jgi:hypothetical protein
VKGAQPAARSVACLGVGFQVKGVEGHDGDEQPVHVQAVASEHARRTGPAGEQLAQPAKASLAAAMAQSSPVTASGSRTRSAAISLKATKML